MLVEAAPGDYCRRLRHRSRGRGGRAAPARARSAVSRPVSATGSAAPCGSISASRSSTAGRSTSSSPSARARRRSSASTALLLATVARRARGHHHRQPPNLATALARAPLPDLRLGPAARDLVRAAAPGRAHGMVSGRRVSGDGRRDSVVDDDPLPRAPGDRAGAADRGVARAPAVASDGRSARRAVGPRGARARLLAQRASSGATRLRLSLKPVLADLRRDRRQRARADRSRSRSSRRGRGSAR